MIQRAKSEPQTITRNGRPSFVMVAVEEWNRRTARQGSLAAFLLRSPLAGSELTDERLDDTPRDLAL